MRCTKKIIAMVLVCSLCILGTPFGKGVSTVKATSYTAAQGIAWVQGKVGQAIDDDGVYGAQCVDLIRAYYKYLGVSAVSGNGCDYATNTLPAGWSRVKGGTPQKGDILVYSGNNANPYGHVAIYESDYVTYHQNFNNVQSVQKITSIKYNGFTNPYWGYIRPNWSGGGNNPQGHIDLCTGGDGTISVGGWAFDKDASSTSIDVHVYIGGSAGSNGAEGHILTADHARDDVNKTYGITGKHGFSATITTSKRGEQTVYIYAINKGKGSNVLIGSKTVKITAYNPEGTIDFCNGGEGSITMQGWAFDRSDSSKSLGVHIYIGGYASDSASEGHPIMADKLRSDVNKAYGITGNHGFAGTITTNKRGSQIVSFYAINTGAGGNTLLGTKTVTITEPATQPTTKPIETTSPVQTTKPSVTTQQVPTTKPNVTTQQAPTTKPNVTTQQVPTTKPNVTTKPDVTTQQVPTMKPIETTQSVPTTKPSESTGSVQPTKSSETRGKASVERTTNDKPARMSIKKLKNKRKRKVLVKWKRRIDVDGYQIRYGYGKKKKSKIVSWIKNSITVKKLKKKKKYTFTIRAFKKINGRVVYGDWSIARKIKIKR